MSCFFLGRRSLPVLALVAAAMAGCTGGAFNAAGYVPNAASPPVEQPSEKSAPDASPLMFTANRDGGPHYDGGLIAFHLTANGDVKPAASIAGSHTTLVNPDSLAADASGNLYAADDGGSRVVVFAPGAKGDATPSRIIGGSKSNLGPTEGLAIDASGDLWVSDYFNTAITEYAPNANGNAAPINTIAGNATAMDGPCGMAFDRNGRLFVANAYNSSITVFAKGANGNAKPVDIIKGYATGLSRPFAVAIDHHNRLLVADEDSGVLVFREGARGNDAPFQQITGMSEAAGVMVDARDHIYVADFGGAAIDIYASTANGDATPLRRIAGSNTGLSAPNFLTTL